MGKLTDFNDFDDQDTSLQNALDALELLERRYSSNPNGIAAPSAAFVTIRRAIAALAERAERPAGSTGQTDTDQNRVIVTMPARRETDREVVLTPDAFICRHCGESVQIARYPGSFKPNTCEKPNCQQAERERLKRANAERVKRYRAKHKRGQAG